MNKKKANEIMNRLYECYPDARCELNYETPFQLLIATVLSAQTTDKKVNVVTSRLFEKYKTPYDFARINQEELEREIREIGLYKNKAKNIIALSKTLIEEYSGMVPKEKEELIKLAGVGRKTANVVVSNAFDEPAIAVDTHVFRVSNRIGIADSSNVEKTEEQLMKVIPKENWTKAHHTIIFHGRRTCKAIKPNCSECVVNDYCKYFKETKKIKV
jgi:endonuclease-3